MIFPLDYFSLGHTVEVRCEVQAVVVGGQAKMPKFVAVWLAVGRFCGITSGSRMGSDRVSAGD